MKNLSGISKTNNPQPKSFHPSNQKPTFSFDELIGRVRKFVNEWLNLDWIVNFFSPKEENNSSPSTSPASPDSQPNQYQIAEAPSLEIAEKMDQLWKIAKPTSKLDSQISIGVRESFNKAMQDPVSQEGKEEASATPAEIMELSDTSAPGDIVTMLPDKFDSVNVASNTINQAFQTREHEPISSEKHKELIEKATIEAVDTLIQSFPNLNEEKYKQDAKGRAISQINPNDDMLDQQEAIKKEVLKRLSELEQEQIDINESIDGIINGLIEEKFPSLNFNEFKNFIKKETRQQFEKSSEILRMADISSQQEQIKDFVSRKLKALDEINIDQEVESKLNDPFWGNSFKTREEIRKEVEKEREEKMRVTKSKNQTTAPQYSSHLQPTTTQRILEPPSLTQRTQTKVKAEDAIRFQTNNEKEIYKASRKNHFEHASLATKTSGS